MKANLARTSVVALAVLLAGCAAPRFPVAKMVEEWAEYMNRDHVLVPGDILTITAFQEPDLTQEVVVSPEGTVNLKRLAQPVRAVDRKVSDFRADAQRAYAEVLPTVEVSVNLKTPLLKSVYVGGRVRRPIAVPWHSNLTITQAISAAGSFLITAKPSDVLVVRPERKANNGSEPHPRSIRVNVTNILYGEEPDFILLPGDVVWCQTSGIADVGDWVELYIRRLLPIGPGDTGPFLL